MSLLQHQPSSVHDVKDQQRRLGGIRLDAPLLFPALLDWTLDEGRASVLLPVQSTAELNYSRTGTVLSPRMVLYTDCVWRSIHFAPVALTSHGEGYSLRRAQG